MVVVAAVLVLTVGFIIVMLMEIPATPVIQQNAIIYRVIVAK